MPKMSALSKIIIDQLTSEEKQKLKKMEKEDAIILEKNAEGSISIYAIL
jgi:hypothetical protein